ncbi:MAG: glycosyltransferase family 4 protein [Burkholderiaceae bacterium]
MRIAVLVSAMNRGGAERVAATLANAWVAAGHEVVLIATWSGRGGCDYALDPGVELRFLADSPRRMPSYLGRVLALRGMLRDLRADVAVSFLTNVNIMTLLATRGMRLPVVVNERIDPLANQEKNPGLEFLRRRLYRFADVVTVQTDTGISRLQSCVPGMQKVVAVANPIPQDLQEIDVPAPDMSAAGPRIVGMGRLSPQKQWDHLLEAIAQVAKDTPGAELVIWGAGSERSCLTKRVRSLGLEESARLPGNTDDPWGELRKADVFVLCSAYEGFPNVLLEAMAIGLPCVTYDCPTGPAELTEHGKVAVLLPLGDRQGLAEAIGRLLADDSWRTELGKAARQSVMARYSLSSVLRQWDEVLLYALTRARPIAAQP